MRVTSLEHQFADEVPRQPEPGVLYVSLPFRTTLHLCACGCGNEVWVPIRPDRHHLTFDGATITLHGSIGNWRFPCRSHYWVRAGRVVWADEPAARASWWRRAVAHVSNLLRTIRPRRSAATLHRPTPAK